MYTKLDYWRLDMSDEIRININDIEYVTAKKLYDLVKNDTNDSKQITIVGTLAQWKKLLKEYRNEVIDEIIEHIEKTH